MKKTTFPYFLPSLFLFLLALFLLQGCATLDGRKGTVKIGLVAPFSGEDYSLGYDALFAAKLAINERNVAGGIGGYGIALIAHDDQNNAVSGELSAHKLVIDPDVMGSIGHPGNESAVASVKRYHEGGLAFITTGASSNQLNPDAYQEVYRIVANDTLLAKEMVSFAGKQKGVKSLAIVAEPITGAVKLADQIYSALPESLPLAFGEPLRPEQTDFNNFGRRLRNASPDMVIYAGSPVYGGALWPEARSWGLKAALILDPAAANPNFIKIAKDSSKGTYFVSLSPYPTSLPEAGPMVEGYKGLAGVEPLALAGLTYDATNLLLDAMQRAYDRGQKLDRAGVVRELKESSLSGITGEITFDDLGERVNPQVYIYQYEGQDFPGRKVN